MYIIFNCVLYWRTLNLNKALLYLGSSTYFFSMLSVLNLIWAVYVGSWSLEKDGACLCLYFCVFFIYGCWAKNSDNNWFYWSSYFQMPDINSDLFGFFWSHCHLNINDMQPDIISSCYRHWKIFISYMGIFLGKRFEINYWLGSFPNEILLFYLDILKASVKHIILRYWKCCTPQ